MGTIIIPYEHFSIIKYYVITITYGRPTEKIQMLSSVNIILTRYILFGRKAFSGGLTRVWVPATIGALPSSTLRTKAVFTPFGI